MAKLADARLVDGTATNFATNVLEIAVPPANPASISSFADLAKPGVKVVVCASQVPCGAADGHHREGNRRHPFSPVSEESSVTDVLGKVTSGEADAGLVYVTDVKSAGDKVKGIPFPEAGKAVNTYPIAAVGSSRNKELAARLHCHGHRHRRPEDPGRRRLRHTVRTTMEQRHGQADYTRHPALDLRGRRRRAACWSCCRWSPWWPRSTGPSSSR